MTTPARLDPLLAQYDWSVERLVRRLSGPTSDSGDGDPVPIPVLTDEEYHWEPVPDCWSIRPKPQGPASGATVLVGAGEWGRDGGRPRPYPPPMTTISWRLGHLSEMLTLRADWTVGSHTLTQQDYVARGIATNGIAALEQGAAAWREALSAGDDEVLDHVGHSTYPDGSDSEEPFIRVVWWVNQEVLHHGAEIALLRDLYRARRT